MNMAKHKFKKKKKANKKTTKQKERREKEKREFNFKLSKQDHLGHFVWLQVHRKSHNMFCNDVYFTKIIYTVQIDLEINLIGV